MSEIVSDVCNDCLRTPCVCAEFDALERRATIEEAERAAIFAETLMPELWIVDENGHPYQRLGLLLHCGRPDERQLDVLRRHVAGRKVVDLGCGPMVMARTLLDLGATHVLAIDKEEQMRAYVPKDPRVTFRRAYFDDLDDREIREITKDHVALASWPYNAVEPALMSIVHQVDVFLYLGKNTDGTACGSRGLFDLRREVLDYVPQPINTLIVYGPRRVPRRVPFGEEHAAILGNDEFMTYQEAESSSRESAEVEATRRAARDRGASASARPTRKAERT